MGCPLISVIVPIYQAEAFLPRCLDSVSAQSFRDWECILVDDGSQDSSGVICDRWATADNRFRVTHQPNSGVSAARNAGLALARGTWIQFVDGDDALASDYCAALLSASEDTDLVIGGYTIVKDGSETRFVPEGYERLAGPQALCERFDRLYFDMLLNSPCNKLYRRTRLRSGFPLGLPMGEDFLFNMAFLSTAEQVSLIPHAGYFYHKNNKNSAVSTFRYHAPERMLEYCRAALPVLMRGGDPVLVEHAYYRIVFHSLCNNLNMLAQGNAPLLPLITAYTDLPEVKRAVRNAEIPDFPKSKRMVQLLLRLGLKRATALGLRMRRR